MGLFCEIVLFLNEVNLDKKKPLCIIPLFSMISGNSLGFFKIESLHCPMNLMLT